MNEYQRAYLAGFIDADGCICISRALRNKYNKKYYYTGRVDITNRNLPLLKLFQEWVGGGAIHEQCNKNPLWSKSWHLMFGSKLGEQVLIELFDYLILKQPQAKLYIDLFSAKQGNRGKWGKYYDQNLDYYESLYLQMKMLNTKGKEYLEKQSGELLGTHLANGQSAAKPEEGEVGTLEGSTTNSCGIQPIIETRAPDAKAKI